jgi:pentatricopeptide repeat protein
MPYVPWLMGEKLHPSLIHNRFSTLQIMKLNLIYTNQFVLLNTVGNSVQGMYNEACVVFDDMQGAGCKRNVVTYTGLLFAYSNAGLAILYPSF